MSCPGVPAVTFVYANWIARYPEFAGVGATAAGLYFQEGTLYCKNSLNPVPTVAALTMLLYMVTAHIAALNSPTTAAGANPGTPTGRISQAAEGSVSVTYTNDYPPGTPQWWQSTKYGAAFWAASLPYRLFRYKAPCGIGPASLAQIPWTYPNGSG